MHQTIITTFLIFVVLTTILATEEYERRMPSRFQFARSQSENESTDPESRQIFWLPSQCDTVFERGYTCYSCRQVQHCMLANIAFLAVCTGRQPYCYNGRCSDTPMWQCRAQNEQHLNATQPQIAPPTQNKT